MRNKSIEFENQQYEVSLTEGLLAYNKTLAEIKPIYESKKLSQFGSCIGFVQFVLDDDDRIIDTCMPLSRFKEWEKISHTDIQKYSNILAAYENFSQK